MGIRDRSKVEHTSFFTDEDGDLILPEALKIGNYRIEEVSAPFGYVVNDKYVNLSLIHICQEILSMSEACQDDSR